MGVGGLVWALQWASPRTFLGYAEELTIGSLVLALVAFVILVRRGWIGAALGCVLLASAVSFATAVRAGRVVVPQAVGRGKLALVTGANQGLGLATTQLLAEGFAFCIVYCATVSILTAAPAGYHVVLGSRNLESGQVDVLASTVWGGD
jgi:hypothetical protein